MVTEDTIDTTEQPVKEEKVSKKSKPKKSKYDFTESGVYNTADMHVYEVRVKETDDDGNRAWKEYKVARRLLLNLLGTITTIHLIRLMGVVTKKSRF